MSDYGSTTLTEIGAAKLAAAINQGQPIGLTHLVIGDGEPAADRQSITQEIWRGTLNNVMNDPTNPPWSVVEAHIPADQGGWTITEIGILDADGDLFAHGIPVKPIYKPLDANGELHDMLLRLTIHVGSTDHVTLMVDPSITLASHAYVLGTIRQTLASLDISGISGGDFTTPDTAITGSTLFTLAEGHLNPSDIDRINGGQI